MYDGYSAIASAYDRFNADVDYERWSDFIEACFGTPLAYAAVRAIRRIGKV